MSEIKCRDDLKIVQFKAPLGSKRQIVFDYYMKMATFPWTASEDFCITWAPGEENRYVLALEHKKGKTYYGVPYGNTKGNFDEFLDHIDENGNFTCDSYYYRDIVGNHCSSSMFFAFQQIIPVGYGTFRPSEERKGLFSLAGNLKNPGAEKWYSKDVFELNGVEAVYEAFASVECGDILFKCIPGSGHVRMVKSVEVKRDAENKIDPDNSFVYVVEHTNLWYTEDKNSSWYIDKRYKFSTLFRTGFMPITADTFHDNTPITDAYIFYDGHNENTFKEGLSGKIFSNYPLNYVRITINDKNGNTVKKKEYRNLKELFSIDLNEGDVKDFFSLPCGSYKFKLRAGIARGSCNLEEFELTL